MQDYNSTSVILSKQRDVDYLTFIKLSHSQLDSMMELVM